MIFRRCATIDSFYINIVRRIRSSERAEKTVIFLNKAVTLTTYISYPCVLIVLFIISKALFFKCLAVPMVGFAIVTVIRKLLDKNRPYENLGFTPIIKKKSKGESFPSRHAFSVMVIAIVYFYCWVPLGIAFVVLGLLLGCLRIIGGVHYLWDVVAGYLLALLCGIAGYYIL